MRYWDDGHMDGGWGVVMLLAMLGLWIALIAAIALAIVFSVRATRASQEPSSVPPVGSVAGSGGVTGSAEQILADRLARGDIDTDEYLQRLNALASRSER